MGRAAVQQATGHAIRGISPTQLALPAAAQTLLPILSALCLPPVQLHIPKEGVTIAFNPSGVRCPQRGQPAAAGRPAVEVRSGEGRCSMCCSVA